MDVPTIAPDRARRWAMYVAARPVFERAGFRASTVAELAWAAGLRPASLYHYFPSKAAFALFPLSEESGLCATWHDHVAQLPESPELRLDALFDFIVGHLGSVGLAFSLAQEMSDDPTLTVVAHATISQARRDFRLIGESLDPDLEPPTYRGVRWRPGSDRRARPRGPGGPGPCGSSNGPCPSSDEVRPGGGSRSRLNRSD